MNSDCEREDKIHQVRSVRTKRTNKNSKYTQQMIHASRQATPRYQQPLWRASDGAGVTRHAPRRAPNLTAQSSDYYSALSKAKKLIPRKIMQLLFRDSDSWSSAADSGVTK